MRSYVHLNHNKRDVVSFSQFTSPTCATDGFKARSHRRRRRRSLATGVNDRRCAHQRREWFASPLVFQSLSFRPCLSALVSQPRLSISRARRSLPVISPSLSPPAANAFYVQYASSLSLFCDELLICTGRDELRETVHTTIECNNSVCLARNLFFEVNANQLLASERRVLLHRPSSTPCDSKLHRAIPHHTIPHHAIPHHAIPSFSNLLPATPCYCCSAPPRSDASLCEQII